MQNWNGEVYVSNEMEYTRYMDRTSRPRSATFVQNVGNS